MQIKQEVELTWYTSISIQPKGSNVPYKTREKKRVIQKCKGKEQLINSKAMRTLGVGSREGKRALAYENVRTGHFPTDPRQLGQFGLTYNCLILY
ncbi:hypothetical protein DY000_02033060 [Brassica cretica]|uniref:Uncharacterized protein n=1 Tax=Brassica cretica TaxID=69181 RepID=A0ABQ7DJP5_BRACR|nr:hypothetical protein DY000_02033060 [Brassica cretica]